MAYQLVDLIHDGPKLTLQWRAAPGHQPRDIDAAAVTRIEAQAAAVTAAERALGAAAAAGEGERGPLSARLAAAQRVLGETLFQLLDGAERALARRLEDAQRGGEPLHLVVRLRARERRLLGRHPALGWRLSLLAAPPDGPLALAPDVTLAVQLGDAEVADAEVVPGGRLQLLFMAYSPADVQPLLDHEGEEQRILETLSPFIEEWRLLVRVVEDGSLDELRRRMMKRPHDIVHLTGHGVLTAQGPRLVMEDDITGARDDVSPERLLKALKAGKAPPRLVVISSCHSAERRDDLPSFAAELVTGGIPAVIGWNRPVREDISSIAAEELYHRLCAGDEHGAALASARRRLHDAERDLPDPEQAWAMLELFATRVPGFRISDEPPVRDVTAPGVHHRRLGAQMRVMTKGFVGRRRELQRLGRLLRHGGAERPVAGALVVGMKGSGKSSLIGRAVDRYQQDGGELLLVVLHGALDELTLLDTFRTAAVDAGDAAAADLLADRNRPPLARIEWLLRSLWKQRRAVIILDDFEQNLDIPGSGDARLRPLPLALLEVLLPACRDHQPKLLVTCTATFELPAALRDTLVVIPLGELDRASVRKLWLRGRRGELAGITADAWSALAERLGGNPRILDWARQLLGERSAERMAAQARAELPLATAQQDELAARFLRHLAYDEAVAKVGADAMTFVARARVYDLAVPLAAFAGLTDGLAVTLDAHVPALANLGLLDVGSDGARTLYRVSPLVEPVFAAAEPARWHAVAAAYWWKRVEDAGQASPLADVYVAWKHALAAGDQDLADRAADQLNLVLDREVAYRTSADLSARHVAVFPTSVSGLNWAGYAQFLTGNPQGARALLERGVAAAAGAATALARTRRSWVTDNLARVLVTLGELTAAETHYRALLAEETPATPDDQVRHAGYRYALATVLDRDERLAEARTLLEEALAATRAVLGTDEHPNVTPLLGQLAGNRFLAGDLAGAAAAYRAVLAIEERIHAGAHPHTAGTHHALATVLGAAGELAPALVHARRSVELMRVVYGGDRHEDVAHCLGELGRLQRQAGDPEARATLERTLAIIRELHGSEEHEVAAAAHHELAALEPDPARAVARFEDVLARKLRLRAVPDRRSVAETHVELAGALRRAGRPDDAAAAYATALAMFARVLGTRDHYLVARAEALSRAGTA